MIYQYKGNFNHMYEWKLGNVWYPCHIICDSEYKPNCIDIYTRNGSIMTIPICDLRKMRKKDYLNNRNNVIKSIGRYAYKHGFHEDVEEDVRLFEKSKVRNPISFS